MTIDFNKSDNGLVPVIVQDSITRTVLMLGYMNEAAYAKTIATKLVTFYSRSKERLWTKGEESGNTLELINIAVDCDNDTILAMVKPNGPTCHKGTDTCWNGTNTQTFGFLSHLETIIKERKQASAEQSYVASLFAKGINKIAQKVGEEAVEVVIEALDTNDDLFVAESADLLFHYLMLLNAKNTSLEAVSAVLEKRHKTS